MVLTHKQLYRKEWRRSHPGYFKEWNMRNREHLKEQRRIRHDVLRAAQEHIRTDVKLQELIKWLDSIDRFL